MKRKEVKILGLSYSQSQTGSYVLVLSERKGQVKLPIIIKPFEAQRIALELENIKPPRPLTHDLFRSMSASFGIDIQEVYIYSLAEGIFYSKMLASNGVEDVEIECSVGDGIILASVYKCPIFVEMSVLNAAGVYINDDGTPIDESEIEFEDIEDENPKSIVSIENLEKMLEEAVKNEEYDIAIKVRDRINELKNL